jgi:DNA-binding response OmpR family regulator
MVDRRGWELQSGQPYALLVSAQQRRDLEEICSSRIGIASVNCSHQDFMDWVREHPPSFCLVEFVTDEGPPLATVQLLAAYSDAPLLALVRDEALGIQALRLGADAIAADPADPEGLAARIEALLRRVPGVTCSSYRDTVLELDRAAHHVAVEGREVSLTPTEFKLLCELVSGRGNVIRHEELLERVWGDRFRDVAEVKTYISYLRRKLGPAAQLIENVRGVGYRYRAPLPATGE